MRVSSGTIFDTNVAMLNQQQSVLLHTNQQVASGRRMLTPADDPAASATAMLATQADATNTQYTTNRNMAKSTAGMAEAVLQSVTTLITDVKTIAVQAGNGALSTSDKKSIATQLQGQLDQLMALANSTDGTGNYLFSGYQGKTIPFVNTAAGVQYMADDGQRMLQVSSSRQMAGSESGADIFMRVKTGNGTFVTETGGNPQAAINNGLPAGMNAGNASISQGAVSNPLQITGNSYQIKFTSSSSYDIINTTTNTTLSAGNAYVSGQSISGIPGMQFSITGTPVVFDTYNIKPSSNESLFKTLSDMITALNTTNPSGPDATAGQLTTSLNRAMSSLSQGLDTVLTVRASLGARLNELDSLQATGEDLTLQYKQTLSTLQDLDYNKAISDLNRQTISLQAAQKSFKQIADLSMFNYM